MGYLNGLPHLPITWLDGKASVILSNTRSLAGQMFCYFRRYILLTGKRPRNQSASFLLGWITYAGMNNNRMRYWIVRAVLILKIAWSGNCNVELLFSIEQHSKILKSSIWWAFLLIWNILWGYHLKFSIQCGILNLASWKV